MNRSPILDDGTGQPSGDVRLFMRATALAAALCISAVGFSATLTRSPRFAKTQILPNRISVLALRVLERDRGIELIYLSEDVRELRSPGASGDLTSKRRYVSFSKGRG